MTTTTAALSLKVQDLVATHGSSPDSISDDQTFVTFVDNAVDEDGTITYGHVCYVLEAGRWEGFWSHD